MDIALSYDNNTGVADWVLQNGDLAPGNDLESAIFISLFTDALATSDFVPWDRTNNRRGNWIDTYEPSPIGSRLWQLDRSYFAANTNILLKARDFCKESLQWLVDTGVAASISITPSRLGKDGLLIKIVVTKPVTNERIPFQFSYYWDQE